MKNHLAVCALVIALAVPASATPSASKNTTKPDKVEKKPKSDDAGRKDWPHYRVNIYGVTDKNWPDLKEALLAAKNVKAVDKEDGHTFLITAEDQKQPVWYADIKAVVSKVDGLNMTGMKGVEEPGTEPEKEAPKKPVAPKTDKTGKSEKSEESKKSEDKSRKAWPHYEVGVTGVTKKNWPDLKKAVLAIDNVEDFAMTEPDKFRITAKDPKKPIWYAKVKEAVAEIDGLKITGMKGAGKE